MQALHSHFMTGWEPAGRAAFSDVERACSFAGQGLLLICALQHICNASNEKFRVTICPGLV
jgi:hypothetical protein